MLVNDTAPLRLVSHIVCERVAARVHTGMEVSGLSALEWVK
jgi:hypothetical protein